MDQRGRSGPLRALQTTPSILSPAKFASLAKRTWRDDLRRVRVVQPKGAGLQSSIPAADRFFPAKRITGWTPFVDLPKPSEHGELGLKCTYSTKDGTVRLDCAELGLVFEDIKDDYLG
jgi:hypothetical protein